MARAPVISPHPRTVRLKAEQERMRNQLCANLRVPQILESIEKLEDMSRGLTKIEIQRIRLAVDLKLKLLRKILPDLKQIEVVSDHTLNIGDMTPSQKSHRLQQLINKATPVDEDIIEGEIIEDVEKD